MLARKSRELGRDRVEILRQRDDVLDGCAASSRFAPRAPRQVRDRDCHRDRAREPMITGCGTN